MIRKATAADKQAIYQIWKLLFSHDDNGYTDYYFAHRYKTEHTWVVEEDGKVVSTLQMNPHTIVLGGKPIRTSLILGVATLPEYQKRGYMKLLMNEALEVAQKRELVTLIQAYNPAIYRPFGFQMIYHRQILSYDSAQIQQYKNLKVEHYFHEKKFAALYQEFTTRFDGYYKRDEAYYKQLETEVKSEQGKFAVYRNAENQIEGYMVYYLTKEQCEAREIIYLNSWALYSLIGFASSLKPKLDIHTSHSEQVLKLIPGGSVQPLPFMMAKVNDYSLLNMTYRSAVQTVEEAFAISGKPLWMHEYA